MTSQYSYNTRHSATLTEDLRNSSGSESENEANIANFTEIQSEVTTISNKLKNAIKSKKNDKLTEQAVEDLEDYYERALQLRIMENQSLRTELNKTKKNWETDNKKFIARITMIRSKCLVRKFQVRFYQLYSVISTIELFYSGIVRTTFITWVYPITMDVIVGDSKFAIGIRLLLSLYVFIQFLIRISFMTHFKKLKNLIL